MVPDRGWRGRRRPDPPRAEPHHRSRCRRSRHVFPGLEAAVGFRRWWRRQGRHICRGARLCGSLVCRRSRRDRRLGTRSTHSHVHHSVRCRSVGMRRAGFAIPRSTGSSRPTPRTPRWTIRSDSTRHAPTLGAASSAEKAHTIRAVSTSTNLATLHYRHAPRRDCRPLRRFDAAPLRSHGGLRTTCETSFFHRRLWPRASGARRCRASSAEPALRRSRRGRGRPCRRRLR